MSPEPVRPSAEGSPEGEEMESDEVERSKVRGAESAPSAKEVEERNVDHAVFSCIKGRAETTGTERLRKTKQRFRRSV